MLSVGILHPHAYGVGVKEVIFKQTERKVTLSTVHSALHRLEKKGMLESTFGEATNVRGGKRKKYFIITAFGARCLKESFEVRKQMYHTIPIPALQQL